jgi:hypothetical protein
MDSDFGSEPTDVVILTEAALTADDVRNLLGIYRDPDGDQVPDPVAFRVIVPADTETHLVSALLEHLGTGELTAAWRDIRPNPIQSAASAADKLAASLDALRTAGAIATGEVTEADALDALRAAVAEGAVREVAVVTYPHAFEDTFHTDWASRARGILAVPVLHVYAGTSELG